MLRGAHGFVLVELAVPIGGPQLNPVSMKIALHGETMLGIESMNDPEMVAFDPAFGNRHDRERIDYSAFERVSALNELIVDSVLGPVVQNVIDASPIAGKKGAGSMQHDGPE